MSDEKGGLSSSGSTDGSIRSNEHKSSPAGACFGGGIVCFVEKRGKLPSGAALEALFALGAGDGDFALVPGDPDGLAAAGAGEIAVLPILDPVQHQKEPAVFLVALTLIPGQAAENGPDHQRVAQYPGQPAQPILLEEDRQNAGRHAHAENHCIQPVRAISSGHKTKQAGAHLCSQIAQPAAEITHCHHPGN